MQLRPAAPAGQKLITDADLPRFAPRISTIAGWYDAEHFLQLKDGRLLKVSALTGKAEAVRDPAVWEKALAALPADDDPAAGPAPWAQKGKGGRRPRGSLTAEAIVDAAVDLVESHGFAEAEFCPLIKAAFKGHLAAEMNNDEA